MAKVVLALNINKKPDETEIDCLIAISIICNKNKNNDDD